MRFIIENFGPIEKADITLGDLNIFIGKNSVGKSYLAYLIWALLSVEPDWERLRKLFDEFVPNELIREVIEKSMEKENKETKKELKKIELKLAEGFYNIILESFKRFDEIWGNNLKTLIRDTFMVDELDELVKDSSDTAKIIISNNAGTLKIIIELKDNEIKTLIDEKVFEELEKNILIAVLAEPPYISINYYYKEPYVEFVTENYQAVEIVPITFMRTFDGYAPYSTTFIAPDGRTGLIRSIEAYNYALISGRVTINEVDRAFMRDFMSLYPETKNEEIKKIADFLEEKLGAEFSLRRELPRYMVKVGEIKLPLQRAPSGYRELAPIIYAIKHKLDEGHIIFIEEPEAHLHPDAQIIVTRALAGLSKYCYVVMTTHSITILDEVNNQLRVSKLPPETKRKYGYEDWEGLKPENIKIFLVSDGKVKELEVYEDGIEESDLDRVIMEIANIHAMLSEEYERFKRLSTQR